MGTEWELFWSSFFSVPLAPVYITIEGNSEEGGVWWCSWRKELTVAFLFAKLLANHSEGSSTSNYCKSEGTNISQLCIDALC